MNTILMLMLMLNISQDDMQDMNITEQILYIDMKVENGLEYQFFNDIRTTRDIYVTGKADCTGRAIVKKEINKRLIPRNKLQTRLVHGYVADENPTNTTNCAGCTLYKHDWLEYKTEPYGKWWTNEGSKFAYIKRTGINGVW